MHYLKITLGAAGLLFLGLTPFYHGAGFALALVVLALAGTVFIEKRNRHGTGK